MKKSNHLYINMIWYLCIYLFMYATSPPKPLGPASWNLAGTMGYASGCLGKILILIGGRLTSKRLEKVARGDTAAACCAIKTWRNSRKIKEYPVNDWLSGWNLSRYWWVKLRVKRAAYMWSSERSEPRICKPAAQSGPTRRASLGRRSRPFGE